MNGYSGQVLTVNLTTGAVATERLPVAAYSAVIGGIGLGTALLLRHCPAGTDPLGPENPLVLATSPFAGTPITTSAKYAVVTRSPLTGFIGDSLSSSQLALDLKHTGFDAIILTGQCADWSVLLIDEEQVRLQPAGDLLGLDTGATEAALAQRYPGRAAVIGPAGERLVRFATISNGGRHAGRTGSGAVMGAKRLKAIVVRGARSATVADPEGLARAAARLSERSTGPATDKYRRFGTPANLLALDRLGVLPSHNFQQATFAGAEQLSGEALHRLRRVGSGSCAGCTVGCEHLYRRLDEPPATATRLEYETMYALGALLGIDNPDAVIGLARRCDALGLDSISTGGTIAWAIESAQRGLLPMRLTGGVPLRFGDALVVGTLIDAIGARTGLGDVLAEGSRWAADWLGHGSDAWALHVKGLELPGYDPRGLKTLALGLATSPRGACHNRSGAYDADLSGTADRATTDATRSALAARAEDQAAILDSLTVCKFVRRCFDDLYVETADLYQLVTGLPMTAADLRGAGARITTLKKLFNLRQGWTRADDTLPERLLTTPLLDGPGTGEHLTRADLDAMLDAYYAARGWDPCGVPTAATLTALGLDWLAAAPGESVAVWT